MNPSKVTGLCSAAGYEEFLKLQIFMRNLMKAGLVWAGILLSLPGWGQIRETVPLGVLPMQYIGSFAGEAGAPRLSFNSHYHYDYYNRFSFRSEEQFYDQFLSYDQFIPAIRTGVGLTAGVGIGLADGVSSSGLSPSYFDAREDRHYLNLSIAPKISIKGKYTLSPSVDLSYVNKFNRYGVNSGDEGEERFEGFGSRIGVLWNTPKYYVGYSITGMNRYRWGGRMDGAQWGGDNIGYHFWSVLQVGYTFQKSSASNFSFTPQLAFYLSPPNKIGAIGFNFYNLDFDYSFRSSFISLASFNLNFRYKKFIWGLNNAGIHLGVQNDRLRLMLTNLPVFWGSNKYYIGNLSFRYVFKEKSRSSIQH